MSIKTKVILAKASWCPHCDNFMPVYDKASEKYGENYEFSFYDFADDAPSPNKSNFEDEHQELVDLVDGYPTVFLKRDNKTHTKINTSVIKNNNLEKAVNEFGNNIENGYKNLISDKKMEYISLGGGLINNNDYYKNKYMKYKQKYFELKNKL